MEVGADGRRRARRTVLADVSAQSLQAFLTANTAPGAVLKTDGWSGYPGVPDRTHEPRVIGPMAAHVVRPGLHRLFSALKTWGLGVYHGLRRKHLQADLDAFVFRFNRRHHRFAAFRSLISYGLSLKPLTDTRLIRPEPAG